MDTSSQGNYQQTYLLDPESAAEMGRLLLQDRLLNEAMGGLLPERTEQEIAATRNILDVGCGPGGWAMSVAQTYPHIHVTGIDISQLMISYASVQVEREDITGQIRFERMNALEPLKFADNSFDLVNIRAATVVVPRTAWPAMLHECFRILRPGGTLRLTEFDLPGITNSPAFTKFCQLGAQTLYGRGYGFSPDGSTFGMTPMLGKLLTDTGCQDIQLYPHVIDFSHGSPLHNSQVQNYAILYEQGMNVSVKHGTISETESRQLYQRFLEEMHMEQFRGLTYLLTAWGNKPAQ